MVMLFWFHHRRKTHSRSWSAVCDPELLPHLLVGGSNGRKEGRTLIVFVLAGCLSLFALAGPVWKQLEQPVFRDDSALVLVLDLSRSMDTADIAPSRLARARLKLIDILKKRREGLTALVVFAAEPFVVSPLTQDSETIVSQVSALKTSLMPRQGSRPDLALKKAGALLKQAGVPRGRVLVMTDGLENVSTKKMDHAVRSLNARGHSLYILGVGTLEGAPIQLPGGGFLKNKQGTIVIPRLDEKGLMALARQGRGRYQALSVDDRDLAVLLGENLPDRLHEASEDSGFKTDRWREEGPWLLLPLLPLAGLAFRRGILLIVFLSLLPISAQALDWETLWSRPDQRAAKAFAEGDADRAADLFEHPEWKAAAHYRAGLYEKSVDTLEGINTPDAFYNKGNALARLSLFSEAIQAYDEALKRDPEHQDALYNKNQLLNLMNQENQNQQNRQDGDASENDEGDPSSEPDPNQGQDQEGDLAGEGDDFTADEEGEFQRDRRRRSQRAEDRDNRGERDRDGLRSDLEEQHEGEERGEDRRLVQAEAIERDESQQAIEQWLRRIPDDPGGLLRRKFLFQSKQRRGMKSEEPGW